MNPTSSRTTKKTDKSEDIVENIVEEAGDLAAEVRDRAPEVISKVKDFGSTKLKDLRGLIADHPFEAVAASIAIGLGLRSLFRSPATLLLLLGGAGYLGYYQGGRTGRNGR